MTRLAGALPKDPKLNGLHAIEDVLISDPEDEHLLLLQVSVSKLTTSIESGEVEATLRVLQVQPVLPTDSDIADRLLRAAQIAHTGQPELPIDTLTTPSNDPGDGDQP